MTERRSASRLGDALVAEGAITQEQLDHILAEQRSSGGMLGEMLVAQGAVESVQMLRFLARQLAVEATQMKADPDLVMDVLKKELSRMKDQG